MTAELEAKIAELETANADLVRQLGEATETNTKIAADVDALRDEMRELEGIKARLLKIENTRSRRPVPPPSRRASSRSRPGS